MIKQNVLPFNLEITNDEITPHAALALFGEFVTGLGLDRLVNKHLPLGAGKGKNTKILSPILGQAGALFFAAQCVYYRQSNVISWWEHARGCQMRTLCVAVVTYRDREFKRSISDVLKEYDRIHVKYCEALSPCYLQVDGLKLVLINADRFHSKADREKELYNVMSDLEEENSPSLFMLTSSMSPEDFLRNQVCHVTDTIDISGGMDVLTSALDTILPRKRQLGLFDDDQTKAENM